MARKLLIQNLTIKQAVWPIAPSYYSYWNKILCILISPYRPGFRKVWNIPQYQSQFTVIIILSCLKKYGLPKSATPHHTVILESAKVFFKQILLIEAALKVTIRFITEKHISMYIFFAFPNTILCRFPRFFWELLYQTFFSLDAFWVVRRILCQLQLVSPRASQCLRKERPGDYWIYALTVSLFSGVLAVRGLPDCFLISFQCWLTKLTWKWLINSKIIFLTGMTSRLLSLKCTQKALWVALICCS